MYSDSISIAKVRTWPLIEEIFSINPTLQPCFRAQLVYMPKTFAAHSWNRKIPTLSISKVNIKISEG